MCHADTQNKKIEDSEVVRINTYSLTGYDMKHGWLGQAINTENKLSGADTHGCLLVGLLEALLQVAASSPLSALPGKAGEHWALEVDGCCSRLH